MDQVAVKWVAAATAASLAGAAYLDGKYALRRDVKHLLSERGFTRRMDERCKLLGDHATMYHILELADQKAAGLWFEGRSWTYGDVIKESDAIAEVMYRHGVRPGAFVAIFMTNSAEMVFTMLALAKLGAVPAMINNALRNDTLLHCMGVAKASIVVATPDLIEHLPAVSDRSDANPTLFSVSLGSFQDLQEASRVSDIIQITPEILAAAPTICTFTIPPRSLKDVAVLIFTSGTSGKPKAVSIKNLQFVIVSTPIQYDVDQPPERGAQMRIFSCLPLFHATCMFTGLLYAAGSSGTFCIARRFSASNFSKSLFESGATRMLYVGELCRYLLKAPPSPFDRAHACRVAKGNGLQKDVWEAFQERFGITEIREFYRSTEGIARFDNFGGGKASVGQVGFEGPLANYFNTHTYLVRHDTGTEAPYRDPTTGFCVLARPGEPGEALGRVGSLDFYHEYLDNPTANKEKLISNVFQKGDLFQRSGDLLVREKDGWVRFLDRSGDSYRWNGENVSAGEVREHISHLPGVQDATVYGVILDKYDGQAGAAAITLDNPSEAAQEAFTHGLYEQLRARGLTVYQIPRLLRFVGAIEVNATFKHLKTVVKSRSWDPANQTTGDSLWWLDRDTYKQIDKRSWSKIKSGKARL